MTIKPIDGINFLYIYTLTSKSICVKLRLWDNLSTQHNKFFDCIKLNHIFFKNTQVAMPI